MLPEQLLAYPADGGAGDLGSVKLMVSRQLQHDGG